MLLQDVREKFLPPQLARWSGLDINLTENATRALLQNRCELVPLGTGEGEWVLREGGRIATENELCSLIGPDAICCVEAMRAGLVRLDRVGLLMHEELTKGL
jgi:hypothetical protein